MKQFTAKYIKMCGPWMVLALVLAAVAAPVAAKKSDKNKKKKAEASADAVAELKTMMAMPAPQAVDQAISEELGYWQIGDVDSLHKYFADDVVTVSGAWAPPLVGWDSYLKAYLAQRATVTGGRMDRSNTLIKVNGNSAWATYQFVYTATVGAKEVQFRGHTTLILNMVGGRWVIVLNHTSVVDSSYTNSVPTPNMEQPGRP
ncbi:MAG TPA: nuclear transport factor 2 family protein [Candidatus Dormibacteraeota bacterium]|nr:nuclear transport factor 2 family protein [Candidatus Dormibacteraeota bacterium]